MKLVIRAVALLALGVLAPVGAQSADLDIPATPSEKPIEQDGWRFAVSPYFWAAGLSGDTAQFGSDHANKLITQVIVPKTIPILPL